MSREIGTDCLRAHCIALAAKDSVYCVVHRDYEALFRLWDAPVTDRIERDTDGMPTRFYPQTRTK